MFKGAIVALVTPFKKGRVDEEALRALIEMQISNGTDGIVPCGTTGESATLSHEEHDRVIEITIEAVRKRVPVIAGTGSNSTAEALRLTRHAHEAGADGVLMVTPYYNKPTQEGLYQHFQAIAAEVPIPVILYNVPGRTGGNLLPETVLRLASVPNIVGIKEASGSLKQIMDVIHLCPDDFSVLSGDDAVALPVLAMGGSGVISVFANVAPADMAGMIDAYQAGDMAKARKMHYRMLPLMDALFIETNPIPVKAALAMMGLIDYEFRLPLCRLSQTNEDKLRNILTAYGLLKSNG
ncbi:MAG: 4-hydroxy-tetrahydrodipicolinate synthase [Deltaproteobacteria bacterium]|nr:4-hydroxy-tetrahydrodipicolinate synthase [Deltaproteobacteria bacterium]